jgi:hypothetical protein
MINLQNISTPTAEEILQAKQNAFNATHPASWVWNEEAISWVAPVSQPTDGLPYLWDENVGNWIFFPDYPRV